MLLKVSNLQKKFNDKQVLNGIDFEIEPGEIVGLLGENGCGKSTLIKCINQLLVFDQGTVKLDQANNEEDLHSMISYLPDKPALDPDWKVKDAIRFYKDFYSDFDESKAREQLKKMDLPENRKIREMSKGMQEKLQLILAISRKARLYILDEPLGGIDPASRDRILDSILSQFEDGSSMLISTHLIADIERILDRVLILKYGRIIDSRKADEIREQENCSIDEYFRRIYA